MSSEDLKDIKSDMKEIKSDLMTIKLHIERNTKSLEYHIKRTDLLEDKIEMHEAHMVRVNTAYATMVKVGAFSAALAGILFSLLSYFKKI